MPLDLIPFLQTLIRFDTTNPPGNERACIDFIRTELTARGFDCTLVGLTGDRPNLITRLPGRGDAPPLLLAGHVDVVTTVGQAWSRPPFSGDIVDGHVWGRGALDMKSGVAMLVAALIRLRDAGTVPAGDLILALTSDEENGGRYGAQYLVENHADQFSGVRYAISEFGGYPLEIEGRRFYAIAVGEKQHGRFVVTLTGPGGHGSRPVRGGAMARLGDVLTLLDQNRLPVHVTPIVEQTVAVMAPALPEALQPALRRLLQPGHSLRARVELGPAGRMFDPLLHHTVSPTIVHAGQKLNVIPSAVELHLDGRVLPGYGPDDLIGELHALLGDDVAIAVRDFVPYAAELDMGLFDMLGAVLREADPDAIPLPMLQAGYTDARQFARLGIQTYGFLPLNLAPGSNLLSTVHGADERVPVDAVHFGADAVYRALLRYGAA